MPTAFVINEAPLLLSMLLNLVVFGSRNHLQDIDSSKPNGKIPIIPSSPTSGPSMAVRLGLIGVCKFLKHEWGFQDPSFTL